MGHCRYLTNIILYDASIYINIKSKILYDMLTISSIQCFLSECFNEVRFSRFLYKYNLFGCVRAIPHINFRYMCRNWGNRPNYSI